MSKENKPNTGTPKGGNGNNNKRAQGSARKSSNKFTSTFKGETSEMNGKVFQLLSESSKRGQFEETLEALQRYSDKTYPLDSVILMPLFKDLSKPIVKEPDKPTDFSEKFKVPETAAPAAPLATIEDENEGIVYKSKIKFLIKFTLFYNVFI